jgi:hypothetical protein
MNYKEDYPEWLKKYCFKNYCCDIFKILVEEGLIHKSVRKVGTEEELGRKKRKIRKKKRKKEIPLISLKMYHPDSERDWSFGLKFCPCCGTDMSKLELIENRLIRVDEDGELIYEFMDEFQELEGLMLIPSGIVGQIRLWDKTGGITSLTIDYNNHSYFKKVFEKVWEVIKPKRKGIDAQNLELMKPEEK